MPQIILKERTAHLGSHTFLREIWINIKTRHFHSSVNHHQQLFHRTLITGFFRPVNILQSFLIEPLQKESFVDIRQNGKLHRKALVLESLFKKLVG